MKNVQGTGIVTVKLTQGEKEVTVHLKPEELQQLRADHHKLGNLLPPKEYAQRAVRGESRAGAVMANAVSDLLRDI